MIYCPHCGTPNKPNSKFCKNCAALLAPSTDVRCPICGTMNLQGAANCSNCGTRLNTGSAGAMNTSDQTTPADSPEQISPFNPPPLPPETTGPEAAEPPPPPLNRPSFARANSEWLRRIQKTPPPAENKTSGPSPTPPSSPYFNAGNQSNTAPLPPAPEAPAPDTSASDNSDWLRALDAERHREDLVSPSPILSNDPVPPKPTLSEIKLTRDDYDYSDIGGEVTDEMKAHLEANAATLSSTDDEVELARRLLGLDMTAASEPPPAPPVQAAPVAESETPAPPMQAAPVAESASPATEPSAKPVLSEIKLTRDDYDYSDIGGEVTDEMKAHLEANAGQLSSTEDEVAMARRLLGLDLAVEAMAGHATTPEPKPEPFVAPIEPPPAAAAASEPPIFVRPESAPVGAQPVADTEIISPTASEQASAEAALPVEAPPPAPAVEAPPAKPVLSEIRLTRDDYDYSDIGGQVTDEMKAHLEANAGQLSSTEDEVAMARRLLGLDSADEPTLQAPVTETPAAQTPATPPASPEWLSALAATSSAAVAGETAAAETQEPIAEIPAESQPVAAVESQPPSAETTQELVAEQPAVSEPVAEIEPPRETMSSTRDLEAGDLPEWLREIAPREIIDRQSTSQVPAETDAVTDEISEGEGGMPAWVQELAGSAQTAPVGGMFSRLPDLDESERDDLPDWLREPPPAPEKPAPSVVSPASTAAQIPRDSKETEPPGDEALPLEPSEHPELVPALDLPSWITDVIPGTAPMRDPYETIETSGPLAGVSGILPLALAITEPHTLTSPSPTRSDGGRIFQTIVSEPLAAAASVRPATRPTSLLTGKHILYLVIFFAALIPLFLPLNQAGLGLDATKSPTAAFYDQLQAVPENGAVLVAFDYSPGQSVELAPAARDILNNLAARHINVIAVSTGETGATIAQDALKRTQETTPSFNFANVGYIFGREAGISAFAKGWLPANQALYSGSTWQESPLSRTVQGMNDIALTILLTADENDLRAWMEQAGPYVTSPIVAATSAELEPKARTYVSAKQLQATLRGLNGAAELELLSNTTGQAVKTIDAVSFVSLVLAGILIAANVMGLSRRGKKENN